MLRDLKSQHKGKQPFIYGLKGERVELTNGNHQPNIRVLKQKFV